MSDMKTASAEAQANDMTPLDKPVLGFPLYAGMAIVVLFFGVFGFWAVLAPLESAAIAPGFVSVDIKRKTVQHLEGGIVNEILVRDGDKVVAGQVMIRLDKTQPLATLSLLKGRFDSALALEARLQAESENLARVIYPETLIKRKGDDEVARILQAQDRIFEARLQSIKGQEAILNQRIAQLDAEIAGVTGEIKAQNEQLLLITDEIDSFNKLFNEGLTGKSRLLELKRLFSETEGERNRNKSAIARVKQNIAETNLEINDLHAQRLSEVVQESREVRTELYDLREKIRGAEDISQRTDIKASLSGTVVGLSVHTLGGVIAPGEDLLDIVPSGEQLVIEARLNPDDIDSVEPGLRARITFPAYSSRTQVPMEGTVLTVSADSFIDERTGESYYETRVALAENSDEWLEGRLLYPGMKADVMITTGSRTSLQYILQPITQSFSRAFREN